MKFEMKILIYGSGVIGSIYAARLKNAGQDVTLLARGSRLEDLKEGVVLEDSRIGYITKTLVPLVDRLQPGDAYDLVIVVMRRNQTRSILTTLAENKLIPNILFLVNNAAGPQEWVDALGRDRVLIGLPNAGGERRGNIVRFILIRSSPILFGELDGKKTARVEQIIQMFKSAGLLAAAQKNMDACMKSHVALVAPGACAIYMAAGDIHRLARMRECLILLIRAV
jgi:2-dehydropantoate 2-reductase